MGNNVVTLEDFNTLLGLYGGYSTVYTIDSTVFDGEGKYDFLDVTVSGSNYVVTVVNSLFSGFYSIVTGSTVSFDEEDTFTFPVSQETSINLFLGLNVGSNLEFAKFVTRPCYTPYTCGMVVYDSEGELVTDTPVSIGDYTGTTDSDGEVSITIPGNRADLYQLIVSVDGTPTDVLELLRTKVYLNPVCTTNTLYKESTSSLSFNVGNIGHSVVCQCVVNGYTYNANSNSSTGVVSFNINLKGFNGDNVDYSLKCIGDDWVYETNITGTVECEYCTVNSWNALTTAYADGIDFVKATGTITMDSRLTVARDFKVIGETNNNFVGTGDFDVRAGAVLELVNINSNGKTGEYFIIAYDSNILLTNCTFENSSCQIIYGTSAIVDCNGSSFTNCKAPVFMNYKLTVFNIDNSNFSLTDFDKTSSIYPAFLYSYMGMGRYNVDRSTFNMAFTGTSDIVDYHIIMFRLRSEDYFNNALANLIRSLPIKDNRGDIDVDITVDGVVKHYDSSIPGAAFTCVVNNLNHIVLYMNVDTSED